MPKLRLLRCHHVSWFHLGSTALVKA
jgi:hypothetical protein